MAILSLDFFGSDPSKMDQTRKFGEQTSRILEFKMSVHQICKFDPFWTDLIQKKSKRKMAIFILFRNVTTFYSNIF